MTTRITILLLALMALTVRVHAQTNTDSIFAKAISLSKSTQLVPATVEAKKALIADPKRADIMVFLANLYSWQNKNDSALLYIGDAQKRDYHQSDLYEAWTNILLRSGQYAALLSSCTEAEKYNYSNREDLIRKKMIAYEGLKEYDNGIQLIELPENSKYLDAKPIDGLYSSLLLKRNKNVVSAYYMLDMFNGGPAKNPQHLASVGYSFPVGNNNLGFRANYANRFGLNGVQLESDYYLKLPNKRYMYFNYGYAFNSVLFPTHRVGFEYYFPLPAKMEASIGTRYMNYPTSNVIIATGHIEKYVGNSWFAIRPFYVYAFKKPVNTTSFTLLANYRLLGKNQFDYWGLEVGIGNSPDQFFSNSVSNAPEFNQLKAYKVKLEKNIMLNRTSDLHIGLGYSDEEYKPNQFRNRITLELGYKIRLK